MPKVYIVVNNFDVDSPQEVLYDAVYRHKRAACKDAIQTTLQWMKKNSQCGQKYFENFEEYDGTTIESFKSCLKKHLSEYPSVLIVDSYRVRN